MEARLRGILEKEIEAMSDPIVLETAIKRFQESFPMTSMHDCLFGYVVGFLFGRFSSLIRMTGRRVANPAEIKEFWEMIERRTLLIKGNIRLALGE